MAPKQNTPAPAARRRQWQTLRGILGGKRLTQIGNELGIEIPAISKDAASVSARLRPENAQRIRMLMRENRAQKFTPEKADKITALAKKIILGEAELPRAPEKPAKPIMPKIHPKEAAIINDLQGTKKTMKEIAADRHVRRVLVQKIYHRMLAAGEVIPERNKGRRLMSRKTGVVGVGEIPGILAKNEAQIARKARDIFWQNRRIFRAAAIGPEDIAQYIRRHLPQKLEIFDPGRMKKAPPEKKLNRYISFHISHLALDMLKTPARAMRRRGVALQRFPTKEPGRREGEVVRLADIPERAVPQAQDPQETIDLLERISRKAGLLRREKAVVFAKIAGISGKRFAAMTGTVETNVSLIYTSARKKIANAGIAPGMGRRRGG